jgi:uncharacterized surface anchored protein
MPEVDEIGLSASCFNGFSLMTDDEGSISLARIPPGTYEFEVASEIAAPISLEVAACPNNATVRFKAR